MIGVKFGKVTPDGKGRLRVKPGTYDILISRGPEYEVERQRSVAIPAVDSAQGVSLTVRAMLRRVVDTAGFVSGDYHQHTQGSIDSPVPLRQRVIENMAEGVEFEGEAEVCRQMGFQLIQGYLTGKPVPIEMV